MNALRRRAVWSWNELAILAAAIVVCTVNLGSYRPLTTHEHLVAQTAREMLDSGDWLVPHYFGQPRLQKPPLAYWETAVSFALLGKSEGAARLPAAISGILLVAIVFFLAGQFYARRTARMAAWATLTSVYFVLQFRLAEVDATLAMLVATALYFLSAPPGYSARLRPYGFWIALGLTVLAKGPVGLLMIGSIVAVLLLDRRWRPRLQQLVHCRALIAFSILSLSWPLAIVATVPGSAALWWQETLGRVAADPHGSQRMVGYYLIAALWLTLPWTPLVVAGIVTSIRRGLSGHWRPSDSLLLAWFLMPVVVLSFSAGKQEHYLIPALVPCSLWAGRQLALLTRKSWSWRFALAGRDAVRAMIGIAFAVIVMTVAIVLPQVDSRRETAVWVATASKQTAKAGVDPEQPPRVLLGHSVQWLGFYAEGEWKRLDSIEAFLDMPSHQSVLVITSRHVLEDIRNHRTVEELSSAPADPKSVGRGRDQTVVLARIETTPRGLSNKPASGFR